ncbi:MAG TPA: MarR family transcriptional regulator [Candidatus Dormibacteraeota bacterium]|nr:MarR family transcriptional regulator [Candidatus Dormibacteraeota bacterium]
MARPSKPTPPPSTHLRLEGEVVGLWLQMQGRLQAHFTRLAADYGLSAVQAKVLLTLQPGGAMTMRVLAAQLEHDASNLTGVVDRLEELGAVRRESPPHDRRAKNIVLTDDGRRRRQDFWQQLTSSSGPLGQLNSRELSSLRGLLRSALGSGPAQR